MVSWNAFRAAVPTFGECVEERLAQRRHCTLATLRADGSARLSGTEWSVVDGECYFGAQAGAARIGDLARDARVAIHVVAVDADPKDRASWPGDVRIEGRAYEVDDAARAAWCIAQSRPESDVAFSLFRVAVDAVVWVHLSSDGTQLLVDSWRAGRGGVVQSQR